MLIYIGFKYTLSAFIAVPDIFVEFYVVMRIRIDWVVLWNLHC